jgi:hypothetical protein
MEANMDLSRLLRPLLPEHLGVLAIGCLAADAPTRPKAVKELLGRSSAFNVSEGHIAQVIERVIARCPELLGNFCGGESALLPRSLSHAVLLFRQVVPTHWQGHCVVDGGALMRTSMLPTLCFTLTLGLVKGDLLVLRCADCGATYCGPWCWPTGGDAKTFPEGQHRPKAATNKRLLEDSRWFFATPQVCFETSLLRMFLLLAARGGVSWTALFTVYFSLFGSTLSGTQYAGREHFIKVLEVAVA